MKALLLVLAALLPLPAAAGTLTDALMAPGLFADAADGPVLAYDQTREVPEGGPVPPIAAGRLLVTAAPGAEGRQLVVTREEDGKVTPVAEFPLSAPNPVLLYFLETTMRAAAQSTGGSPFYIRNRIREALAMQDLAEGSGEVEVVLEPFATDPNRARLKDFAGLTLTLRFDPAAPGRLLGLSADTPGLAAGYHEHLVLIAED